MNLQLRVLLAVLAVIALAWTVLALWQPPGPIHSTMSRAPHASPKTERPHRTHCGVLPISSHRYRAVFHPDHGPSGTLVRVTGPTLRGEGGRYYPERAITLWWNTRSAGSGPPAVKHANAFRIAADHDVYQRCRFSLTFRVPESPASLYPIEKRDYFDQGYGIYVYVFRVTEQQKAKKGPI